MKQNFSVTPSTIWITGLSASGKSTLAKNLYNKLINSGLTNLILLDGEDVRARLTIKYGHSPSERFAVTKKIIEFAKEYNQNGQHVIVSTISHMREMRMLARENITNLMEIFLNCPVQVCSERDYKGQYKRAFAGEYDCFIGVTHPYEESENPELTIDTAKLDPLETCNLAFEKALQFLDNRSNLKLSAPETVIIESETLLDKLTRSKNIPVSEKTIRTDADTDLLKPHES